MKIEFDPTKTPTKRPKLFYDPTEDEDGDDGCFTMLWVAVRDTDSYLDLYPGAIVKTKWLRPIPEGTVITITV